MIYEQKSPHKYIYHTSDNDKEIRYPITKEVTTRNICLGKDVTEQSTRWIAVYSKKSIRHTKTKEVTNDVAIKMLDFIKIKEISWIVKSYNDTEIVLSSKKAKFSYINGKKFYTPYLSFIKNGIRTEFKLNEWRYRVSRVGHNYIMKREDFAYCMSLIDTREFVVVPTYRGKRAGVPKDLLQKNIRLLLSNLKEIYKGNILFNNSAQIPNIPQFKRAMENGELYNCIDIYEKYRGVGMSKELVELLDTQDQTKYPRGYLRK